jgi:hypothetical protein
MYLDDLELRAIEEVDFKEKIARLEEKVAEKHLAIEALKQQNLELQYKLSKREVADAANSLTESKEKTKQRTRARKGIFVKLADKYGLRGSWGYDPLDGLIHLDQGETDDN